MQYLSTGNLLYPNQTNDIIVLSHLRWEFVWQRPQHIMQRLSRDFRILFVEEPIGYKEGEKNSAHIIEAADNITVLQPRVDAGDHQAIAKLISIYTHSRETLPIVWLYSAAMMPIAEEIDSSMLIYDCMDELSAFKNAPKELRSMESALLAKADIVFTGGKSLYKVKKRTNTNTFCFPSSVDRNHFSRSNWQSMTTPKDMKNIKAPVVGFYGVIDERMDLKLLSSVAEANPSVNFVMIGPVVKIDPAHLPKKNNIHYLGPKEYKELPSYLRTFDIAMMPFAKNKSTRFISPTKTLEYLAASKPVISTAIHDVVEDYSEVVAIIENTEQFSLAIKQYLGESIAAKKKRVQAQKLIVENTSWDKTVKTMKSIILDTQDKKAYSPAGTHIFIKNFRYQLAPTT